MSMQLKKVGILLLTGLISMGLVTSAYASSRSIREPKVKRSKVELGKNWERSGRIFLQNSTPEPKKNLWVKPAPPQNQVSEEYIQRDPDKAPTSEVNE